MVRADPGDPYDGVGWGRLTAANSKVENEYVMWRKDVFADEPHDAGTGDNGNQVLSPRFADRE